LQPLTLSLPLHVNLTGDDADRASAVFLDALGQDPAR